MSLVNKVLPAVGGLVAFEDESSFSKQAIVNYQRGSGLLDTGLVAVPTSSTSVNGATVYVVALMFVNTTAGPLAVTVENTASVRLLDGEVLEPHRAYTFERFYGQLTGIKWFASAAGVNGQIVYMT